jgi:hypothetical protein
MQNQASKPRLNKSAMRIGCILTVVLLAIALLWQSNANSNQAISATLAQVYFEGEYRIGDGSWQPITEGQHIPATRGDVTLLGKFHMLSPGGEYIGVYGGELPIALYADHVNLTIREGDRDPVRSGHEHPMVGASGCGVNWVVHSFSSGGEDQIEILIHNPHSFGNELAIDELLSNLGIRAGIDFEKDVLSGGENQRNTGLLFVLVSLAILGTALFSTLIHIKNSDIIWLFGLVILFAGVYLAYSAYGISFWKESVISNTVISGASMMLYMFFLSTVITYFLTDTKAIGRASVAFIGAFDALFFVLPMLGVIFFYDTLPYWIIAQSISNLALLVCLIKELFCAKGGQRLIYIGTGLPLIAFAVDAVMTAQGFWKGGLVSKYIFIVLFIAALIVVLRIIPRGINASAKARELELQKSRLEAEKNSIEAELKESRISIMLSQIKPHFIYNTLGTIERMCLKDPQKAFDLVRNFSLYLRGNFSELNSVTPIRFTEELEHVEYYVNIEKVRFPDMNIEYDVQSTDFLLPALSVQPLVENAIKHGLMRLETGGKVIIRSYETQTHFCVEVKDDGVGFDTSLPIDQKKHVGLHNIRERLRAMVNGELMIESEINVGTKAVIMIPKE